MDVSGLSEIMSSLPPMSCTATGGKWVNDDEEAFLDELREFYEETQQFKTLKRQVQQKRGSTSEIVHEALQIADDMSGYLKDLDKRMEEARQTLTEPIDDTQFEQELVERLESEVKELQKGYELTESKNPPVTLEAKRSEVEELVGRNILKERELVRRRIILDINKQQMDVDLSDLERMESNESIRIDESDALLLMDATESQLAVDVSGLDQRRQELETLREDAETLREEIAAEQQEREGEIALAQEKLTALEHRNRQIFEARVTLADLTFRAAQIKADAVDADGEMARVAKQLENQDANMRKLAARQSALDDHKREFDAKATSVKERKAAISAKQERLGNLRREIADLRSRATTPADPAGDNN